MAWTRQTRNARRSIRTVSRYRSVAATDAAVVRRRGAPVQSTGVSRWIRSMFDVRRIRALCTARRPGPAVLSQNVCRIGLKRRRNNRRRRSLFSENLTNLLACGFVANLSLALASFYDCGKGAVGPSGVAKSKQKNEGDAQQHDPQSETASGPPAGALFTGSPASRGSAHRQTTGVADSSGRASVERPHQRRFHRQWRNR